MLNSNRRESADNHQGGSATFAALNAVASQDAAAASAFLQQQHHQVAFTAALQSHPYHSPTGHTHLLDLAHIAANHERLSALQTMPVQPTPSGNSGNLRASSSGASGSSQQQQKAAARQASDGSVLPPKPHTQRKYAKICTVCGDKALGYNFDAISCESCKAFFRRNAQKMSSLRCAYNDNCQIDKGNRKLCRRCRLRKCFRVGMRIEYIQSEEQKQRKRENTSGNRDSKSRSGSIQSPNSNRSEDDDAFPCDTGSNQSGFAAQSNMDRKRRPSSQSSYDTAPSLNSSSALNTPSSERSKSHRDSFSHHYQQQTPQQSGYPQNYIVPPNANELTVEDCQLIDEAVNAWKGSLLVMQDVSSTPTTVSNGVASQEDLVNVSEISFRRMVAMFKNINLFKLLNSEDQKALLRGGALDLLIMRSALTYNPETHMFLDPTDDPNYFGIHSSEMRRLVDGIIVDGLVKFVETLKLKLQVDDVMLILLLLITLFSDDRPELDNRIAIGRAQERYTTALQHYIQTMRATTHGACSVLFADLIVKLRELRGLSTTYETVVPFLKQWAIKPLMRELLKIGGDDVTMANNSQNSNQGYYNTNNLPPGVDEDLAAAQQLFLQHRSYMASRSWSNWATEGSNAGGGSTTTANSTGGQSSGTPMSIDQQQPSPGNPSSVLSTSTFSFLGQYADLPSVNANDLP